MAQIIKFPSGTIEHEPQPAPTKPPRSPKPAVRSKVSPIKRGVRVPKANRPEDDETAMVARIAASFRERSYELAQVEPNSERHRFVQHMAGISRKLPRNNLRVFSTPDDIVEGIWKAWRRVHEVTLEWQLYDHRRMSAVHSGDEDAQRHWSALGKKAEALAWLEYERLIRIPASGITDFKTYKLDRRFERGMGSLEWMRKWKPELAEILDEEQARLVALKDARAADRAAKKRKAQ
jgi:hypothetical protein